MDGTFARVIEVMFGINMVCAVAWMAIFWQRDRRKKGSGLHGDPRGIKWLRELTEDGKLMSATCFPDATKPRCPSIPPRGLQGFVDNPEGLDEWARNHLCWTEDQSGVLRLKFECDHEQPRPSSKHVKPLQPLVRRTISWWNMIQNCLDRTGLIIHQQPFMLNRLPLACLLATVLTILGGTVWILHDHLRAMKSQDDYIPLPSDLYLVIGVLVKVGLTLTPIAIVPS